MPQNKDDDGNCVGIQTEDDDLVIYDRGNPSSAWIRADWTVEARQ